MSVVESVVPSAFFTIGHFTQLVHDKNTNVGCAAVEWTEDNGEKKATRITCNYIKANYFKKTLYDAGPTCSDCSVCDEEDFLGLCIE